MPKLFRIVYCSRSCIPGDPDVQNREIESVLAASRRNNVRHDITGALLFTDGSFAQVLEGRLADVEATLALIARDPRHGEVTTLEIGPIDRRDFGEWSMAFAGRVPGPVAGAASFANPSTGAGELLVFLRQAIYKLSVFDV
jgi:hypothetical protein